MESNIDSTQPIRVPTVSVSQEELIQRLIEENAQQQQLLELNEAQIDELTNTEAILKELVQQLRDEIAILTGQNPKPKIKPSLLEGRKNKDDWRKKFQRDFKKGKSISFSFWVWTPLSYDIVLQNHHFKVVSKMPESLRTKVCTISSFARKVIKKVRRSRKPGQPSGKPRKKKTQLKIHEEKVLQPACIPEGAVFKGYRSYTVQDIIFTVHNTRYQIAQWVLPNGDYIRGELPQEIHGHYGPELIAYILHQYYACRVTQPLLLNQLIARGVLISAGQLNNIIIKNKDLFHEEASELLSAGVATEAQIQVDDTGGRHAGKNQYTTVIGNRWFSFFTTTESKSRVNFFKLLQQGKNEYLINEDTIEYLKEVGAPSYFPGYLSLFKGTQYITLADWEQFLREKKITNTREIRLATEAALYASVIEQGIPRDLGVHGDDAGQFDAFVRSLCWIHEERHYRKLIMTTDQARADLARVRDQIWTIYEALKDFKESPCTQAAEAIDKQFDDIFLQKTSSPTLNDRLKKTYEKKEELLRVLQRPETPLHNNSSETDARSAKTKLKVSGGTRSDEGKTARDTFLSLKQTCLKLGINFIDYLRDRARGLYVIPKLAEVIIQRTMQAKTGPPT